MPNIEYKSPELMPYFIALQGYVLALVVEACLHHQKSTRHPDPFHVTAHFLRATAVGPFEVRVHTIRSGRGMSNIHADLVQDVCLPRSSSCLLHLSSCVIYHGYCWSSMDYKENENASRFPSQLR